MLFSHVARGHPSKPRATLSLCDLGEPTLLKGFSFCTARDKARLANRMSDGSSLRDHFEASPRGSPCLSPRALHGVNECRLQLVGFEKRLAAEYPTTIDVYPVIASAAAPEA